VGRQIEDIDGSIHTPSGKDEKLLIHFFNPNSALCRIQGLAIDNLQKEFRNILRFDTSHHEEVARAFRVSQTPTMVVLARKKVEYVFVGVTDEEKLRRCLVP
jgi:thioredoxin-like negative regulator of GroEL